MHSDLFDRTDPFEYLIFNEPEDENDEDDDTKDDEDDDEDGDM